MDGDRFSEKHRVKEISFRYLLFLFFSFACFLFYSASTTMAADFMVVVDDASNISVAQSNGDGTWGALTKIDYLGGTYSREVTINDFDNDGDFDFVVGRRISNVEHFYLFLNDGSDNFAKTSLVGTQANSNSYAMASGDFNNDGNMDFVANGTSSMTAIWLGDGQGNFSKTEFNFGANGRGMDTADFDHDGNVDIVRSRYSNGYVDVHWGDGTGTFPSSTYLGDVGSDPYGVVAGDFDEDGHPDVFANDGSGGNTYFIKGNGDGTFQTPVYEASLDLNNHGSFDAYDYNGDGHLDVLIANYTGRTVFYYPGFGDGTFDTPVSIGTTASNCLSISAMPSGAPANRPVADILPAAPAAIAEGGSIDFNGSGSADSDGTIASWAWAFGDGGADTAENPVAYTFADEGFFAANLLVTDNEGKKDRAVARVTVLGDIPVVNPTPQVFGEIYADYGIWDIELDGADYASDSEGDVSYNWSIQDGFAEGFEDGDASGWTPYAGTWEIEDVSPIDGTYSYRQANTSLDRTWNLFDQYFDTDLIIEADVHLASGSDEEAHIVFRAQNQDNHYYFILRGRGYNDVLLYRRINGDDSPRFEYDLKNNQAFSGADSNYIDVGGTYAIKIVLTGSMIEFYLDGVFLFAHNDTTFMNGRVGLSTYRTHAVFDNIMVTPVSQKQIVTHQFNVGTHNVELTATDEVGQSATGVIPMTMALGDAPVADAGGPYSEDETAASGGFWTVALDGSASFDDVEIQKYEWDLGTDDFAGTQINDDKWVYAGSATQNDEIAVPGINWGQSYLFSKNTYDRSSGAAFEARVKQTSDNAMVGFKNTNTTYQYGQMPYAIYFADGNIHIYENGSSRGDTDFNYSYNTWYDIRIELKETQGARYYYRLSGDSDWILLYDSDYGSETTFKRGFDVHSGTFVMDDLKDVATVETPTVHFYGQGTHPVSLTVYDRAGQSHTNDTVVTTTTGAGPVADGGLDVDLDEASAADGFWTGTFDASGSSDDLGIYTYEWDWNYDGTFDPSGDTGVTASHLWDATGTYTVAVRVTDHALQSHVDTVTVVVEMSAGPVADGGLDVTLGEASAADGFWTGTFDASGSSDDFGISTYEWDWNYDGSTFVPSGDTGVTATHIWDATGTYTVAVRVTDNALQSHIDTITVVVEMGAVPAADAGGPYAADESTGNAFEGAWAVTLDGSGSSDDTGIDRYLWDLGTETFDGAQFNGGKWYSNGGVTQDDAVAVTGANNWSNRYIVSRGTVPRSVEQVFQTRFKSVGNGQCMFGFKNTSTSNFHYNQFPYEFYIYNNNIYIYENSSSRGDTTYNLSNDTWYDFKIELTTTGAVYSYKLATETDWIVVYTSSYVTGDANLRKGMTVYSGTYWLDDFKESAGGATPTVYLSGLGTQTIELMVFDTVSQMDSDTSSVTLSANAAPSAAAGSDQTLDVDEADTDPEKWKVDFIGTGSDDGPNGVYLIEWDFDYDGSTFNPSGTTGPEVSHLYDTVGVHSVAMRVTDHALQSVLDTLTVTVTSGEVPTADAGDDITTEGELVVRFEGVGTDDYRVRKFEWDFGDGIKGSGPTPAHIYHTPGSYTATLTVWDEANQTDTDTVTVNVLAAGEAAAPTANAGGPYNAGAGGPPAYLNASSSTDDHGIVKYFWDVDSAVDSDSDGNFTNDVDVVGRKPFYTYAAAGSYTVTLTVEDGAGQQSSATSTVNVAANLAPDVICVPWRGSDPTIPHEAISGQSVRLKAIVRDAGSLEYRWNYGDGSGWEAWAAVSNKYAIEADHTYAGSDGTPYTAILEVRDSAGLVGQDFYYIEIAPDDYDTKTNIAIDNGLWYIHKQQIRPSGYWQYSSYYAASTSSSLQAFVINSHVQGGDHQEDPYVETVTTGFDYLFTRLRTASIDVEPAGDPDTNGNGVGVEVNSGRPIYEGGPVMDAIASSNTPGAFAHTGPSGVTGRYYLDILRDMMDMYAWGQVDSGAYRGGWRYGWNSSADNSACQWAAIGMIAAEDNFGIWVPEFVKTENDDFWLQYSYNGTGFGYSGPGNTAAGTPSGMVQLAFDGVYTSDPRWRTAEDHMANNWVWGSTFYYATYAMSKALRLAQPNPVVAFSATGLDWYNDPVNGLRKYLVDRQEASGAWYYSGHGGNSDRDLSTPWVVIMLTPALFTQPPEADAGDDIIWAFDEELAFDASGSRHLDPLRNIVLYEWDFDGDGTYDFSTTDPSDPAATFTYPDPDPDSDGDAPQVYTARLRVTDDNDPVQVDIDTREVTVAEPPHAPFADAGGPYIVTAGIPFTLSGAGSSDIDPGDSISRYEWDLDNDGVFFDDNDSDTTDSTTEWTYDTPGVYNIALRVYDNGAYNPIGCTIGVDCTPMQSLPAFTTVTVVENQAPTADAGGPYVIPEGTPLVLDGTGSTDPNGDFISYAWDLDGDGSTDDSTAAQPTWTYMDDGVYTVTLTVSDSLLTDTITVDVTVTDLAPTAAFSWAPEPQVEGASVTFTDASTSFPDTIVSWAWDFGNGETSTVQSPNYTYQDDGTYLVSLTITDEDGSTDTVSHSITIADRVPTAILTGDTILNENQAGSYDAGGSITVTDAIVSYEWDWNYDGTTFNPSGDTGASQSHTWSNNGTYTVAVRVTDDDGSTSIATLVVTVNNTVPEVDAGVDQAINEGDNVSFTGTFTDLGPDDTHTVVWDFGDGTPVVSGTLTPNHTYVDDGVYTVTLTVTDDAGGIGSDTLQVTVDNVAPAVEAGPDNAVETGDSVSFNGSFTDPGIADTHTIEWDFGDGTPVVTGSLTPSHVYTSAGVFTVTLTVTDDDGGVGSDTLQITATSVAPLETDAGPDQSADEGDTVNFIGSFLDPGAMAPYTIAWDFGDGSTDAGDLTPSHVYVDDGVYTATLTVTNSEGVPSSDTLQVTVNNVSPTVEAGANQTADEGDTVNFSGSFTDPGVADTHTIVWDFGDGTPVVTGSLTPSHAFSSAGTFTVTLTVTDDEGGVGSDTLTVTVNPVVVDICGDLDNDGDVDRADMMILRGALRKCTGVAGFVSEADYDGDGCVTFTDYRIWYSCYKAFLAAP